MGLHKLTAGDGYTYLLRQVAVADGTDLGRASLTDYYSSKGETPGRWVGSGLTALGRPVSRDPDNPHVEQLWGVPEGSEVTEDQMKALFGEGLHPNATKITEHLTGIGVWADGAHAAAKLGRPFRLGANENDFTRRLRGAYSSYNHTTGRATNAPLDPEVRAEIRTTVAAEMFVERYGRAHLDERELTGFIARLSRLDTTAVAGYDLTFTPVKSVSALWALAPLGIAKTVEDCHHKAVADTLAFLESQACFSRMGTNGVAQVDAGGFIAAAFDHRDSRAGDPNLHTHVAVSNKVCAIGPDGIPRWLALDGQPLYKAKVSASELYNTLCEANLIAELGVSFANDTPEPGKRPVREIVGMSAQLIEVWSSRRAAIEHRVGQLAKDFQQVHGREPSAVEMLALSQQATLETRAAKHEPRSLAEQRHQWRTEAIGTLGSHRELDAMVAALTSGRAPRERVTVTEQWVAEQAAKVIGTVSASRSTWQINHVRAEVSRVLRYTDCHDTPQVAERIIAAALGTHSIALTTTADTEMNEPDLLRRRDGASVYTRHDTTAYTSAEILAAERRILHAAGLSGGHVVDDDSIGLALLEAHAQHGVELNDGQQTLLRDMATSGARVQLALAPAGTGKTTAMAPLAAAWANSGGNVIGLAPTAAAAEVLAADLGAATDTIDKLVQLSGRGGGPPPAADDPAHAWFDHIGPQTLIVVDEAGMASTAGLDAVISHALAHGASVRLVGDDKQLASVAAGGVLRDIVAQHGALTLSDVVRFTDPIIGAAEGAASLALRDGDPTGIAFYLDHGRVHVGAEHVAADMAYQAWSGALGEGRDALLIAPTNELVAELNERARLDRLRRNPHPDNTRTVTLSDGLTASVGDWILTRSNARWLHIPGGGWVKNGHRWVIKDINDRGTITVSRLTGSDTESMVRLPARYVQTNTTLGYARTINGAQGSTARHECHVVGSDNLTREQLYVALTRGRCENHIYFSTSEADPHAILTPKATHPPTAVDILSGILRRDGAQVSAHSTQRAERDPFTRLARAADMYTDALSSAAEQLAGTDTMARIDAAATALRPDITNAEAWPVLRRNLALLALDGHDPQQALAHAAQRPLGNATDPAALLDWRLPNPDNSALDIVGPLRWLPSIPTALQDESAWARYLTARAQLVEAIAEQIREHARAWTPATAPVWARPLAGQRPGLLAEIAVFRAAHDVDPADTRITGPTQHANRSASFQALLHQRLDAALITGGQGAKRWRTLAENVDPNITADPFWPRLATHLDQAARAGADVAALLNEAMTRHGALPDELPAAALWWRLAGTLAPATLDASNERLRPPWTAELHRILGSTAAEIITGDPAWPALVAAVNASDWPSADLLAAAAEYLLDALDDDAIRPDEYARVLTYRVELLTHYAADIDTDIPHPAEGAAQSLHEPPLHPVGLNEHADASEDEYLGDHSEFDDSLGDLDFYSLLTQRPAVTADLDIDITELRARCADAKARARALADAVLSARRGPAEQAAAAELIALHRRHVAQRPHQHDLAHAHADWVAAEAAYEGQQHRMTQLEKLIARAESEHDQNLAQAYRERRGDLATDAADLAMAVIRTHAERDAATARLHTAAGGPDRVVTAEDIEARRALAVHADIAALRAARAEARNLDNQLHRAEARTARSFAENPAREREQARWASVTTEQDVMVLRAEVDFVEAAGSRSPATVYPPPAGDRTWEELDEPARAVVETITASMQSVHVLTVGPDADKHAALAAISAAAVGRGKHVLAMPATETATAFAEHHTYTERSTDPATTRQRIDNGQWTIPPGHLLIVDDADHLNPNQLRYFTEHAGRSNTKLLLVHTPTEGRTPPHSLVDALADNLPWAQRLGTPTTDRDTAIDRAGTHLAAHEPVTPEDRDAAQLLARRDTLRDTYQTQFKPRLHTYTHEHTRDPGLEL
ncbi:exonuclease V subunit alpha [Mycolicibacterium aromaticivorans JS19b1 = JCM 16368]|uniref:Exonuclease V subunit alpha n=1 Tax=Mycolicibacterium aromaticivorans JS19b1 = JCM 16368 TaxID=1440774 RepID=A0A064CEA3_9MYCO|nr:MobF family relaxase [Mycolicibacterium aromaticivorans]KDE97082.1 exonuclease V subunit alpha [Mycolicibacterium aromaticivorans JS19b1 = JCM 16368]